MGQSFTRKGTAKNKGDIKWRNLRNEKVISGVVVVTRTAKAKRVSMSKGLITKPERSNMKKDAKWVIKKIYDKLPFCSGRTCDCSADLVYYLEQIEKELENGKNKNKRSKKLES